MAEDVELGANSEIVIENIVGQPFSKLQIEKNTFEQAINVKDLPNGIYFIKIMEGNNLLFTNKFVKQ
ncbi:MAG: Secretion system C-terminal sorting domain [Bacteroidota bacterium]